MHVPIDQILQHLQNLEASAEGQLLKYSAKLAYERFLGGGRRSAQVEAQVDARLDMILPQRLRDVFEALAEDTNAARASIDDEAAPSVVHFAADAIEAAFATDVESKRRLLGDLIAKRLTTATDSPEEGALQLALSIVRLSTETQLIALAAVMIKDSAEAHVAGDNAAAVEAAMDRSYGRVIRHPLLTRLHTADLDHLEALGALRQGSRASGAFLGDSKSRAYRWFEAREVASVVEAASKENSTDSYLRFDGERFPTLDRWVRLLQYPFAEDRAAGHHDAIPDAHLTPAGSMVATIVQTRLSGSMVTAE